MRLFKRPWSGRPLNTNRVTTTGFSNKESERLHAQRWEGDNNDDEINLQCGGCSFYAAFNQDYGLCCNPCSRHLTETVFEHFTCPSYVHEGWGPHSFTADTAFHCKCQGSPVYKQINFILALFPDREGLKDDEIRSHLRALRKYVEDQKKD
jgi:hypothetical protein